MDTFSTVTREDGTHTQSIPAAPAAPSLPVTSPAAAAAQPVAAAPVTGSGSSVAVRA